MLEGLVLGTSHLFYATRADLLRRPERNDEAADACGADGTVTNPAERVLLGSRLASLLLSTP